MTIQANFPNVQPSLLLDFANAKQLPPSVNFTRATTAAYYDGSTTARAEQNLLQYSQDWSSGWGLNATATTVTANSTTAPNGTNTATQFSIASTTSLLHYAEQNFGTFSGQITASAYFKAGTQNFLNIAIYSAGFGNAYSVAFDLSTGAITKTTSVGSVTNVSSTITSVGSGWYRVTVTATFPTALAVYLIFATNSVSNPTYNYQNILESYSGTIGQSFYVWGAQAEQRSSAAAYTATTTQAITNYIPVLLTAGGGQPRFDHNPTTSESLGLLVEEQRTNILNQSNDLSNWGSIGSQASGRTIVPTGELSGVNANRTGPNNLYTILSVSNATTYTFSVYAKAGFGSQVNFGVESGFGTYAVAGFNLSSGIAPSPPSGTTVSMTSVGNGWYRLTMTGTTTSTSMTLHIAATTADYTNGVWVWGAQLEVGAFATSYISTNGAAATRAADLATMTGVNFSSWFNNGEGTFYSEVSFPAPAYNSSNTYHFEASDGTSNNRLIGYTGGSQAQMFVSNGGTTQAAIVSTSPPAINTNYRCAFLYEVNNFALSVNAQTAVTDNSGTVPSVNKLNIAANYAASEPLNGWMKKLAYYPQAVTSAQLQALTS